VLVEVLAFSSLTNQQHPDASGIRDFHGFEHEMLEEYSAQAPRTPRLPSRLHVSVIFPLLHDAMTGVLAPELGLALACPYRPWRRSKRYGTELGHAFHSTSSGMTRCLPCSQLTVRIGEASGKPPGCHHRIWQGIDLRFLARGEEVIGTRAKDEVDGLLDQSRLGTRKWSGAMSHTLFGNLNGVYTLDCDDIPSEDEIWAALHLRAMRDYRRSRKRDRGTVLTAWHGGWTREGMGIFSADIRRTSRGKRTRHLGRACVNVRTPRDSGSRTWNGVAY